VMAATLRRSSHRGGSSASSPVPFLRRSADGQAEPLLQDPWMVITRRSCRGFCALSSLRFAIAPLGKRWTGGSSGHAVGALHFVTLGTGHPDGRLLGVQDAGWAATGWIRWRTRRSCVALHVSSSRGCTFRSRGEHRKITSSSDRRLC